MGSEDIKHSVTHSGVRFWDIHEVSRQVSAMKDPVGLHGKVDCKETGKGKFLKWWSMQTLIKIVNNIFKLHSMADFFNWIPP